MSEHIRRSPANTVCPRCGGSGALRLGDQSYRTCLDCLGQGVLPNLEPATTTAAVLRLPLRDDVTSVAR